jgi:hypothetical protein
MKLKKERIHQCGHSNIDFRSKKDTDALKIYQPWKVRDSFGTMGRTDYKPPREELLKYMKVTDSVRMPNQNNLSHIPDPRFHKTAEIYFNNKIPFKTAPTNYDGEKLAPLYEPINQQDKLTGDSMMIAETNKLRKIRKHKTHEPDEDDLRHKSI